jgi:hypothetical protein
MGQVSANTETTFCEQICDGSGGTTVVEVTPPHPTYSDLTGGTVVQLNMVVLGGPNGLNS